MYALTTRKKIEIDWNLLLAVLAFGYAPLNGFFSGVFVRIPLLSQVASYILPICIYCVAILDYKKILQAIKTIDICAFLVLILFILLSWIFYLPNRPNIEANVSELFLEAVPFYVIGLVFVPSDKAFNSLYYTSCISVVLNVLYFLFFFSWEEGFAYSMSAAYNILIPILVCTWFIIKKNHRHAAVFSIVGFVYLLFLGTRGPMLILIVFIAALLWTNSNKLGKLIAVILACLFCIIYMKTNLITNIALSLKAFAYSKGFSIRIFDFILNNDFITYTSGRDEFYSIVRNAIYERPICGYGIYGDWMFLNNPAHRIWLEIWCHYGVILGSLLMLFMLLILSLGFRSCKTKDMKCFLLIWAVHLIVRGVFGSSYLAYYSFLLWGLCINQIRAYKSDYCSEI